MILTEEEIRIIKDCELEIIGETDNFFAKQRAIDKAVCIGQIDKLKRLGILKTEPKEVSNG